MLKAGVHADDAALALLVEAFSREGRYKEAVQAVVEMEDRERVGRISPGLQTLNALIRMFASQGLSQSAFHFPSYALFSQV